MSCTGTRSHWNVSGTLLDDRSALSFQLGTREHRAGPLRSVERLAQQLAGLATTAHKDFSDEVNAIVDDAPAGDSLSVAEAKSE